MAKDINLQKDFKPFANFYPDTPDIFSKEQDIQ